MLDPREMYHVCWVVDELPRAMRQFSELGLRWARPVERAVRVGYADGRVLDHRINVTYSCDGPLHVELVERSPGSVWEQDDHGGPHHVGFWSNDLRSAISNACQAGNHLEAWMVGDDALPARFAYLRTARGQRFEYVDSAVRPDLEAWLGGSEYVIRPP